MERKDVTLKTPTGHHFTAKNLAHLPGGVKTNRLFTTDGIATSKWWGFGFVMMTAKIAQGHPALSEYKSDS